MSTVLPISGKASSCDGHLSSIAEHIGAPAAAGRLLGRDDEGREDEDDSMRRDPDLERTGLRRGPRQIYGLSASGLQRASDVGEDP